MKKTTRSALIGLAIGTLVLASVAVIGHAAPQNQQESPIFRTEVDLVQLSVAVTDHGGHYIRGLRPGDFRIFEDGIPQKVSTFAEGAGKPEKVSDIAATEKASQMIPAILAGSNVFVLFDTSNIMYKGFVYAQDAISDFVRGLEKQDSIAVYSFSRNLLRACPLTPDRRSALMGVRQVVAGDDAALYNSLLLTLQDASHASGRKVVVVFSNGPDNASMVSPEAVRELAESEGIPIYVISTSDATRDEISSAAFQRLASRTGGKAYFAHTWQKQQEAFNSIRQDLEHLYTLSYYPAANDNMNWRTITVELSGEAAKKYHIRTRTGYRPKPHTGGTAMLNGPMPSPGAPQ